MRFCIDHTYNGTLPLVFAAVFFTGAVILCCLGILGEYLARVYTEVKDRPKYIIAQTNTLKNNILEKEF